MTRLFWFLIATLALLGALALGADTAPTLSELQQTKAENLRLKETVVTLQAQLTQCQVQSASGALKTERAALEAEFRATLKPADGSTFDWQQLRFLPAAPPAQK